MVRVEYAARARRDLLDIAEYISIDDPDAARGMLERLTRRIAGLAEYPAQGPLVSALGPGIRRLSVAPYLVIYDHRPNAVRIIRILHGARNWPR